MGEPSQQSKEPPKEQPRQKKESLKEKVEHIHTDDFKTEKVQETPTIIEQQVESPIQAKDIHRTSVPTIHKGRERSESPKKHVTFGQNTVVEILPEESEQPAD